MYKIKKILTREERSVYLNDNQVITSLTQELITEYESVIKLSFETHKFEFNVFDVDTLLKDFKNFPPKTPKRICLFEWLKVTRGMCGSGCFVYEVYFIQKDLDEQC